MKHKYKLFTYIKNPAKVIYYFGVRGRMRFIPDRLYLQTCYHAKMGRTLNLTNPTTFTEKLQWLKLYNKNPEYIKMVDKYEVRKYITEKIGDKYLMPLLGVYDSFDEIDFNKLPNQFVLKCTHDSGSLVICKNKAELDRNAVKKKLNQCLNKNFYYTGREWPYKNVKPRIICEPYIVDESGTELKDYKIFCFNGTPKLIIVDFNRFTAHKRNLYTTDWQFIEATINRPNQRSFVIPKPEKLDEMLHCASILSRGIPQVRIDFYSIKNQIYFGEMTFYHSSGYLKFKPESYDELMGSWIELPQISREIKG